MNNINKKIAELSPTQRALLEQRLKQKAVHDNREQSIPRMTHRNSAPLSFSQARIWFLDQLEPGNAAYNRPTYVRLKGLLNIAVLEQSINEIVRRHEILRTTFPVVDEQPVAAIAPSLTLTLPIVDLSSLPATEQDAEAKRLAVQEAQQIFNLSQSPLLKAIILRLSEAEHILLVTVHHIIFDGWSQGVLLQELAQIYEAFSLGKPSPLPELPIQYADFAHWQRQQLQAERLQSQLAYWKKQLSGNLPEQHQWQLHKKFSCFVIGSGTLVIQCGELLLKEGHQIFGIISADELISDWVKGKGIPYIQPTENLKAFLSQKPFDYLFSIVNNSLLSQEIVELPNKYAINYHDAPLPRYAGVNATSWALMHQKKTHGVTWHVMTNVVDAGDILASALFDIADAETAFTLNGKCYEAAIDLFAQLIDELSSQQVLATKQNLSERTYFSRSKQSSTAEVFSFTAGVFSFNRCAREIDALVRALDFGTYANTLARPKLAIGSDFIIVSQLEVLQDRSQSLPGTVTAIEDNLLKVCTTSYEIALRQVLTLGGQTLSIPDLVAQFGLQVGYQFQDIQPDIAKHIQAFDALIAKHEAFWVNRLAMLKPYAIPYAQSKALHSQQKQYARVLMPVPHEVLTFTQHHWADSLSDFLLAAFAAYLARIGRTDCFDLGFKDVWLQHELVGLESFFAEHVPFRVEIGEKQSFAEVFAALREQLQLTKLHLTFARDTLTRYPVLRSTPDLHRENLFPVIIERVERLDDYNACPGNQLTLVIPSDGKECCWLYDTEALDGDSIGVMLRSFTTFLQAIVTDTTQPIANLPLLSEEERRLILVEWNEQKVDYPKDSCIHQLFEKQVELTPDAVAVVFEDEQLTYHQLNTRANQLAHYLQSLGVKPEVLVGLCVERSVEMVVGLLGILKAGGAYVPLDPTYPAQRLSYMLEDSQLEVLLTQQELLTCLPSSTKHTVCLDRDWGVIEQHSQFNPNTLISSDNLAYVIYTSGSTGKPKGTCIIHQGVVRLVRANNYAQLSPTEVFLQLAPISFDASTFEIWGSLLNGAKLVVFPTQRPSLQELGQVIKHHQITTLWLTAGLFHLMVHERLSNLQSLSQLLAGGDVLSVLHVKKVLLELKNCQLINGYGPTENTTFTCCYAITQTTQLVNSVPIGRAISNTQVYILDDYLQPVPIGVIGEIYIGGDGLARGYLHRPELTAEKFIPNPFHSFPSPRLYRTGDLGRYLPDGNIEFTGRIDHQVKIRGFRIELGEIEAVLSQHPVVLQSVVIAREDIVGDKRLVAYIVVKPQQNPPSVSELRSFLKQQLPEYMIPVAFVTLDTIPLTPNGKIDRLALPIPDRVDREEEYIATRTPTEEIIANIFASVLGIQNVGIHDNFFTLGGHSLLATQLISRLRLAFTVEIPLRTVFESPTVTQLDKTITQLRIYDRGLTLPPIQPIKGDRQQLPLSWAQERLWFLHQLEGSSATYNIPVAMRITGNLDINALQQALLEIVHRHEILRTNFLTVNGIPRQVIHPELTMKINTVDLQQLPYIERETVQKQLAVEEATTPFSLENAPLIRCLLLHLATREYVLLLTMHHIVSDGWSMGVFFQELSALYPAFCAGVPSPLPELPLQYADFAVWQRQWLSGVVLETQLNYWRTQLHGAPSLLQLPTDRPRPTLQTYWGRTQSWTLNTDLTQKLQTLSAESGTTLFMTLYAAFATLLCCYSGQSDILIGSPIANRNRSEIEQLIGFFVNTLVLRTRFEDNLSFKSLLAQVRETTLQAYEHQDVPFEQVVEALQPQRSLSHSPLFQVMFVLQNAPIGEVELPGVTWCQLDESRTNAKFDLTLSMTETSQGLVGEWEYNTDLFDGSTIERMAGHFQNLLSAIVENPAAAVDELPLLIAAEHHQLLEECNDTTSVYPTDKCIHQLVEQKVHLTPDAMPLGINGMVDRRTLPAPDTSSFSVNNSFVQPRNPTEEVLAGIWKQILGLEQIGIHDNFFEVGGHSLLGMQLISQASLAFGVEIPLRLLFEKQTIALFAQAIAVLADSKQLSKTTAKIPPLQRKNDQPDYFPLSTSQQWSWFYDHPYTTTMKFTYYIVGSLNVAALEQSLNEIVRRHDILRTTFPIIDGKPVQVIAPTLTFTVPVINLKELSGTDKAHKCAQLFEQEGLRPFDLENEPLLRTQLLQVTQQEYLLNFFINHIIFDGFSLSIFMEELSVLYNAFNKGLPSGLAELPFQFTDFVYWQQQYISSEVKDIYDDYWKNKLASAQPIFEPSREVGQLFPAIPYTFELSTNLISSLREMERKQKVSLFIIMLTAFKLLLHIHTGKNDIVVAVMNANRNVYETKFLIGFFANRVLLRTHLDGNPSFRELLVRVSDSYFESYDYQSLADIQSGIAAIDHAQVFFNFVPIPKNALYPPIEQAKLVNLGGGLVVTEQDLNLKILDEEDRVHGTLTYTNRLFDAATIEYLVNLYRQILEQAVEL